MQHAKQREGGMNSKFRGLTAIEVLLVIGIVLTIFYFQFTDGSLQVTISSSLIISLGNLSRYRKNRSPEELRHFFRVTAVECATLWAVYALIVFFRQYALFFFF